MPMIELALPTGTLDNEARDALVDDLATTLLRWEGAPDTEFFRSITWVYVRDVDPESLYVGGRPGGEPRFRVNVTVPQGALSDRRKEGLVADFGKAISKATGLADEDGLRVWTLINEVPEGNWGAAGQIIHFEQLKGLAAAEREKTEAAEPEPAPA